MIMDFITYFKMGFQKFTDFKSRSTRSEFWWFHLGYFLVSIILGVILGLSMFILMDTESVFSGGLIIPAVIFVIWILASIIPSIALSVRRLHDAGHSGWFYLFTIIPYIGSAIWIVIGVLETQPSSNKWGPVPGTKLDDGFKDALVDYDSNELL